MARYFGLSATQPIKSIDLIREGYPWEAVHRFQEAYHLRDKIFARIIGVSDRTLTRTRRKKAPLDPVSSDRLYRLSMIFDLACGVFEDKERAMQWLSRSQPGLAGKIPLELLDTEPGAQAVQALLGRIEYGVLS